MTERQLRRVWQKKTGRIWRELEERFAPPVPVGRHLREIVDRDFAEEAREATRTDEGEAVLEELLTDYRQRAEEEFQKLVRELVEYPLYLLEKGLLDSKQGARGSRPERCDELRLRHRRRVLEFVAQREVPLVHLLEGRFDTGGRPIPWEILAREWKRAHPKDPLKPDTLRRYYHRARTDPRVCGPFFDELRRLCAEWADRATKTLNTLQGMGARKEDTFVRFTEPRPLHPELASVWNIPPGTPVQSAIHTQKLTPELAAAFRSAARVGCVWTARAFALPPDSRLCARHDCRGCRVFRALRKAGFLDVSPQALTDPELLLAERENEVRQFREQFVLPR